MILPRASLHPLLSSFLKQKTLNSEGNCEAEVSLSLPLVWWDFGVLGSTLMGSAPRGLPSSPWMMGSQEDNSDLYLTLGGTKEFPFASRNTEIDGQ